MGGFQCQTPDTQHHAALKQLEWRCNLLDVQVIEVTFEFTRLPPEAQAYLCTDQRTYAGLQAFIGVFQTKGRLMLAKFQRGILLLQQHARGTSRTRT